MKLCIDCGKPVTTGRTATPVCATRCMLCETARIFRDVRLPPVSADDARRFFDRETANDKIERELRRTHHEF